MKKKAKFTKKELELALEKKSNEYTALVEKVKSIVDLLRERKLISQEELGELQEIIHKNYGIIDRPDNSEKVKLGIPSSKSNFSDRFYG
tara:strand:- start:234 stop:500 length:267 start_codon:yes stop_codon:yes gene_type:complete